MGKTGLFLGMKKPDIFTKGVPPKPFNVLLFNLNAFFSSMNTG